MKTAETEPTAAVPPAKVLTCQSFGFLAIIIVCLIDELVGLSSLVLGNHTYLVDFRDGALKMLMILCVWLLVSGSTRRIMDHAQHLAKFMKVCAWCRRIECEGRWLPLESFLRVNYYRQTTHGICADCMRKTRTEIPEAKAEAPTLAVNSHPSC